MINIGDLVVFTSNPKKLGVVVEKKIVPDKPYASPLESFEQVRREGIKRGPERLALLCYWVSGGSEWVDPRMLVVATEGSKHV
jgi:hypothetical protein